MWWVVGANETMEVMVVVAKGLVVVGGGGGDVLGGKMVVVGIGCTSIPLGQFDQDSRCFQQTNGRRVHLVVSFAPPPLPLAPR